MAKKRINLKQRLDELRNEPAAPVSVSLVLEAGLVQQLKSLAADQQQSLEIYVAAVLSKHCQDVEG